MESNKLMQCKYGPKIKQAAIRFGQETRLISYQTWVLKGSIA